MFTLIGIGTIAAFLYSLLATLTPGILPDAFKVNGEVEVYFEAASVIITLVLLGQVLELKSRHRTGDAIRQLLDLVPAAACLVQGWSRANRRFARRPTKRPSARPSWRASPSRWSTARRDQSRGRIDDYW